ncbi:phospholipase D-like domain-containing anti-phage protein [Enterocloster lavalensis]|uniref:phospholipase D-like domain-containing anti-phage protein n=1 Tax=Enterocloster lavalensis TaxID=460384 RepID=UPI002666004D|nr:phospholipase D-like domain-containing anti-phage protein [Enterocloster lavalensis]
MVKRYSSRREKLDEAFLNKKLLHAKNYDRIAGYFCSSILEVAGEAIEAVSGTVRVVCNSGLLKEDVDVACHAQKMKQEWCAYEPEEKYASEEGVGRLVRLYRLLSSGKLQIRVMPDEVYGLMHGKAGVITYDDGSQTSFVGSINETKSAFRLNYEMVWEDDSAEAIEWVQSEFDFFWNNPYAVNLCDFVVEDIERISRRRVVPLHDWREHAADAIPAAAVEEPVFRKEFGLWEHQKYFVELAFREHQTKDGARFLLADQVGLGKTIQLAMSAKLMALSGDEPILIIVPKTLVFQWQDEMKSLLDMPSAVWTGHGWQDETGYFYPESGIRFILKCPRRVGIVSQGLVARRTESARLLLQGHYECVILDEAHRARRRNPNKDADKNKADSNFLLQFINEISSRTKSLLLATATPVQVNTIEAFDLINALSIPNMKVMGDQYSEWHKHPQKMLDMVCGKVEPPESENAMWDIMRNPFPGRDFSNRITRLRNDLDIGDDVFVLPPEVYTEARRSTQNKIRTLYVTDGFVRNFNPYIRHIVRRTREYLESTINEKTGEPYLKKIEVVLYGENNQDSIPLEGYLRQAYEKAQEFCNLLSQRVKAGGFMSTLILKRIGSTILAGETTAKKMLAWTEEGRQILADEFDTFFEDDGEEEDGAYSEVKQLTPEETELLRELVQMLTMNRDKDPKYERVMEILTKGVRDDKTPWKDRGCIIFSQYFDSAKHLAETLSVDIPGNVIGLYAGGDKSGYFVDGQFHKLLKDDIKSQVKERKIKILVGTDAASEGLNLQTLSTLINLDLPWNPTRLEQRKGRIQRIGQLSDSVSIYNMRYKDSVEDKVHKVLSQRLNDIYDMFGQIPDTLEDVWIDVATNNVEQAMERINAIPQQNPFTIKYETIPPKTEDWNKCAEVLDKSEKMTQLLRGW